jgi:hypothetical protein
LAGARVGGNYRRSYIEPNLALKEEILAKTTPPGGKPGHYKPGDKLLAFLKNL